MNLKKVIAEPAGLEARVNKSWQIPQRIPPEFFAPMHIRGPVDGENITPELAYAIGLAVGSEARENNETSIIVGRDGRLSGPALHEALCARAVSHWPQYRRYWRCTHPPGLLRHVSIWNWSRRDDYCQPQSGQSQWFQNCFAGQDINHIGYYRPLSANCRLSFCQRDKVPAEGNSPYAMGDRKGENRDSSPSFRAIGSADAQDTDRRPLPLYSAGMAGLKSTIACVIEDYIRYVTERVSLKRPLKIVIDCGNGVPGLVAPALYRALGCEVIELYCDLDGCFPNHHPDPLVPENLEDLIQSVAREKADLGLAFDGDGDRLGIVTNEGEIIWPDRQMMLFSQEVLAQHPGAESYF